MSGLLSPPVTPSDNMPNPTNADYLVAHMLSWNGTNWVRFTGSSGGGGAITGPLGAQTAAASVAATLNGQGQKTSANSTSVTLASDIGNLPSNVAQINGTTTAVNAGAASAGSQRVVVAQDGSTVAGFGPSQFVQDALAATAAFFVGVGQFNGATVDRLHSNLDNIALIASGSQAPGTINSADQTNWNGRGVKVFVNIVTIPTGTCTVAIQGKDPVSGTYYTILTSAVLNANGFTVLRAYPGLSTVANLSANDLIPRTWRVQLVVSTGAINMGVACSIIN